MVKAKTVQLAPHLPTRFDFTFKRPARRRTVVNRSSNEQARRAGGPQDRALYNCACGYVFTAAVSTSVGCPHCGTSQAW